MRRRAVLIAVAALPARAVMPEIGCTLTLQGAGLRLRVHNRGRERLQVLAWGTPFEGWFAPFVRVWRDGTELAYQGPSVKRGDPDADEYLSIEPGRAREVRFTLEPAFDAAVPGRYRIEPQLLLHDVAEGRRARLPRPRAQHQPVALHCAALEFDRR